MSPLIGTGRLMPMLVCCCWASLASDSAAEPPAFQYPLAVAAKTDGTLYVVDLDLPGLWQVKDGAAAVYFQADKKFRTPLNRPRCVAIDTDGRVLAGCTPTRQVYRFDDQQQPVGLVPGVGIGMPMSIAVHASGEIYVADLELHCIWKVPAAGGEPTKFVDVPAPRGLAFDKEGHLWVVSHAEQQLVRVAPDGQITPIVKERIFEFQHNVTVDDDLTAYVTDGYARAVWKVPFGGAPSKLVEGTPLDNPVGIVLRGDKLIVADPRAKALFEIDRDGKLTKLELSAAAAP